MKSAPPTASSSSKKTKTLKKGGSKLIDRSQLNLNVSESNEEKLSLGNKLTIKKEKRNIYVQNKFHRTLQVHRKIHR